MCIQEADRNNNGKAAHSAWRNYDDFNEYFWFVVSFCFWWITWSLVQPVIRVSPCLQCVWRSPACFELDWPMRKNSPFLLKPLKKGKRVRDSLDPCFCQLFRSMVCIWTGGTDSILWSSPFEWITRLREKDRILEDFFPFHMV